MGLSLPNLGKNIWDAITGEVGSVVGGAEHLFGINQPQNHPAPAPSVLPQINRSAGFQPLIQPNMPPPPGFLPPPPPAPIPPPAKPKVKFNPGAQMVLNTLPFGNQLYNAVSSPEGQRIANSVATAVIPSVLPQQTAGGNDVALNQLSRHVGHPVTSADLDAHYQTTAPDIVTSGRDLIGPTGTAASPLDVVKQGVLDRLFIGRGGSVINAARGAVLAGNTVQQATQLPQTIDTLQHGTGDEKTQAAVNLILAAASGAGGAALLHGAASNVLKPNVKLAGARASESAPVTSEVPSVGAPKVTPAETPAKPVVKAVESANPNVSPKTVAVATGQEPPLRLSPIERQHIIENDPRQQTTNQVELNPTLGHAKGAIAQATGVADEATARLNYAAHLGSKLDQHDQMLLSERSDPQVKIKPHNLEAFKKAAAASDDAHDYQLAAKRAAGDPTLKYGSGQYTRLYFKATPKQMEDLGIPPSEMVQKGKSVGFVDDTRQYRSYTDAKTKAGLEPLNSSPVEDMRMEAQQTHTPLRNNLLRAALEKSNPGEVADTGVGYGPNGERFNQAANANLPFNASKNVNKALVNFKPTGSLESPLGKVAEGAVKVAGKVTKKTLFALSFFHQAHISENVGFAAAAGGEPGAFARGLVDEVRTKGGLSRNSWHEVMNRYRQDGTPETPSTMEFARKMGIVISDGSSALQRFIDSYALSLAKMAKEGGIDANSQLAVDLGKVYNHLLGRENVAVEAVNPTLEKLTSYFALAPHYLRTQLSLVKEALAPKRLGGAGYRRGEAAGSGFSKNPVTGILTPGGAARSAVLGPRVLGALLAVTASAIITQQFPTWKDAIEEAGLNPKNPVPNVALSRRNAKGERQVMSLPADPLALGEGLLTNPSHFLQSRYSPAIALAVRLATNKDWNGNQIADSNDPNFWPKLLAGALGGNLPIGVQNAIQVGQGKLTPLEGVGQEFGGRVRTNPNDPQVQANAHYFNGLTSQSSLIASGKWSQLDPSLSDVSWQDAKQYVDKFNSLHPTGTTDASGTKYPQAYDPVSSEVKYDAYTMTDPATGLRILSPVFYADKNLENSTPGYPSSPLYKLNGTGLDAAGNQAPQALIALEYQHAQTPGQKINIMNANGGQNGWLGGYENDVSKFSQSYQQNLTNYFKGLGWTDQAVSDYWVKHPSTPSPIDQVTFDQPTTDLIGQYYQMTAAGDSTAAAKFFSNHADVLGNAFDLMAQHANAIRAAKGEVEMQGFPKEPANVKQILASMPQGSDKASKKARAIIINGNPGVNQYLANVALYENLSKGAQFLYKNPANMKATEGENINAGGAAGQSFLKSTASLGQYDIGSNPTTGQYSFLQNGLLPAGSQSAAGRTSAAFKSKKSRVSRQITMKVHGLRTKRPHFNPRALPPRPYPTVRQAKTSKPKVKIKAV